MSEKIKSKWVLFQDLPLTVLECIPLIPYWINQQDIVNLTHLSKATVNYHLQKNIQILNFKQIGKRKYYQKKGM